MILLWRLFGTTKPRRAFLLFLGGQTIVINLVTAITIFTQCPNVRTLWDPVGVPGRCWSPLVQEVCSPIHHSFSILRVADFSSILDFFKAVSIGPV